jgi:hypothetical protein
LTVAAVGGVLFDDDWSVVGFDPDAVRGGFRGSTLDALIAANPLLAPFRRLLRWDGRGAVIRGLILAWHARRASVVVTRGYGVTTRTLMTVDLVSGRRRPYLVLLHFMPALTRASPAQPAARPSLRQLVRTGLLRAANSVIVGPALRRTLLRAQVMTGWESERAAEHYGLDAGRFRHIPHPLVHADSALPGFDGRAGVVASGRSRCDWPLLFQIAAGEPWPLTVICGGGERAVVERLNTGGRAVVRSDLAADEHRRAIEGALVYVLCLRELVFWYCVVLL